MKVKQILPLLENCDRIELIDDDTLDLVSYYDGKNNLKKLYNSCDIVYIMPSQPGTLRIYITIE